MGFTKMGVKQEGQLPPPRKLKLHPTINRMKPLCAINYTPAVAQQPLALYYASGGKCINHNLNRLLQQSLFLFLGFTYNHTEASGKVHEGCWRQSYYQLTRPPGLAWR